MTSLHAACIIQTTLADQSQADALIAALLNQQLAACIQQESVHSHYSWQDKLCRDQEIRLSIKTLACHYPAIEALINTHHPYDCPEVVMWQLDALSPDYHQWLSEVCADG
ncbi:divalent-cation tolerance protein CutA [Suttonella sp. R2A3]|uniref:divalent-cation tolerance protein CutA n=1 Tax=Suttonella sp. R2A3 TaxID=2908648 RepID=UPI001F41CF5A|nr:divalent-cation tolerance protein CutA [Suttonella sp. R2A3]UJF24205.1 divalent-cation tolerance protein CutA [Suttonella sp. R2A3]